MKKIFASFVLLACRYYAANATRDVKKDLIPSYEVDVGFWPSTRIVGGEDVGESQTPWMTMMLGWNGTAWLPTGCAGTLISNLHVLTAGHCSTQHLTTGHTEGVYIGAYQPALGNSGLPFHFSLIKKYLPHDNYNSRRNNNDVAILRLATPVNIDVFSPVRLGQADFPILDGDMVSIFGFGYKREDGNDLADTLQVAKLPFISSTGCEGYYPTGAIGVDMVCAGYRAGGVDACQGDSGGPAIRELDGREYQVAIVSWGVGCGRAGRPGVYANVPFFHEWIQETCCLDKGLNDTVGLCKTNPVPTLTQTPSMSPPSPTLRPTQTPITTISPSQPGPNSQATAVPESIFNSFDCKANNARCSDHVDCCSGVCSSTGATRACASSVTSTSKKKKPKKKKSM